MNQEHLVVQQGTAVLSRNSVIRNTYLLLSLTLLFSAATAWLAMVNNVQFMNPLLMIGGYFILLMATQALRNSIWGLVGVFALTGFLGYTLGPILNAYIAAYTNGHQLVLTALGGTSVIFLGLSGYALTTRRDFSYLGGFLFVGVMVAFLAGLGSFLFQLPALSLAVSAAFVLLSSGLILFQTSQIIHGGETNYIMATVGIYVSIYNLFTSLLHLLGAFGGRND